MNCHEGKLRLLGNASVEASGTKRYSVVEIGDQTITGLSIGAGLDNYLQRALNSPQETRLWINSKNVIVALENEGKAYATHVDFAEKYQIAVWAVVSICLIPVFLIGVITTPFVYSYWKSRKEYFEIQAKLTNPIFL